MENESHAYQTIEDAVIDSPKHCNFTETVFRRCELKGVWEHDNLSGAVFDECVVTAEFENCAGVE